MKFLAQTKERSVHVVLQNFWNITLQSKWIKIPEKQPAKKIKKNILKKNTEANNMEENKENMGIKFGNEIYLNSIEKWEVF